MSIIRQDSLEIPSRPPPLYKEQPSRPPSFSETDRYAVSNAFPPFPGSSPGFALGGHAAPQRSCFGRFTAALCKPCYGARKSKHNNDDKKDEEMIVLGSVRARSTSIPHTGLPRPVGPPPSYSSLPSRRQTAVHHEHLPQNNRGPVTMSDPGAVDELLRILVLGQEPVGHQDSNRAVGATMFDEATLRERTIERVEHDTPGLSRQSTIELERSHEDTRDITDMRDLRTQGGIDFGRELNDRDAHPLATIGRFFETIGQGASMAAPPLAFVRMRVMVPSDRSNDNESETDDELPGRECDCPMHRLRQSQMQAQPLDARLGPRRIEELDDDSEVDIDPESHSSRTKQGIFPSSISTDASIATNNIETTGNSNIDSGKGARHFSVSSAEPRPESTPISTDTDDSEEISIYLDSDSCSTSSLSPIPSITPHTRPSLPESLLRARVASFATPLAAGGPYSRQSLKNSVPRPRHTLSDLSRPRDLKPPPQGQYAGLVRNTWVSRPPVQQDVKVPRPLSFAASPASRRAQSLS